MNIILVKMLKKINPQKIDLRIVFNLFLLFFYLSLALVFFFAAWLLFNYNFNNWFLTILSLAFLYLLGFASIIALQKFIGACFVRNNSLSLAELYEKYFFETNNNKSISHFFRLKKAVYSGLVDKYYNVINKVMILVVFVLNLIFWRTNNLTVFSVLLFLILSSLVLNYLIKNSLDKYEEKIFAFMQAQNINSQALQASFNMAVSLKAADNIFNKISYVWEKITLLSLKKNFLLKLSKALYLIYPIIAMYLFFVADSHWWLSLPQWQLYILFFNNLALGLSLAYLSLMPISLGTAQAKNAAAALELNNLAKGKELRLEPIAISGRIDLKNIGFAYEEGGGFVFKGVNLNFEPKKIYQITGFSGSGKTTLLKLLSAQCYPTTGELYFDDQDILSLDLAKLRSYFAIIPSEIKLFAGTIYENIICDRNISKKNMEMLFHKYEILHDLLALPMGLNTYLFEGHRNLSYYEMLLLGMARALLSEPRVIFADEIFSNLNLNQKNKMIDFIRKINVTTVLITHEPLKIHLSKIIKVQDKSVKFV